MYAASWSRQTIWKHQPNSVITAWLTKFDDHLAALCTEPLANGPDGPLQSPRAEQDTSAHMCNVHCGHDVQSAAAVWRRGSGQNDLTRQEPFRGSIGQS